MLIFFQLCIIHILFGHTALEFFQKEVWSMSNQNNQQNNQNSKQNNNQQNSQNSKQNTKQNPQTNN